MILLLAVLLAGEARADAISGPPEDCPAGSVGQSSHAGDWCEPASCPASCPPGERCAEVGLCVLREERACGGRPRGPDDDCRFMAAEVTGTCDSDADCGRGKCEIARRCVPAWYCGCANGPSPSSAAAFGALLLLLCGARRHDRPR